MRRRLTAIIIALFFIGALAASGWANTDAARIRVNTALRYITMGWLQEASQHASEAVKVASHDPEARVLLAMLLHAQGDGEAALWHYDLARTLDAEMAPLAVFMGDIRREQGRLDEAASFYRQALSADGELGLAHYGLGRVLEIRDTEEAMAAYEEGVRSAPDVIDMRYRLGRLLREAGRTEEALDHLLHASHINPDMVHVRYELGLTYESLHRFSAAEHEYRTALRLDPGFEPAQHRLASLPPS